jgi:hypothetical protein
LTHGEHDGLGEAFENGEIAFIEGESLGREDFKKSDYISFISNWGGSDRTDFQVTADLRIHPAVILGVIAAQGFCGANALSGEACVDINAGAEWRPARADAGAAHHRSAIHQGYGCP